MYEALSIGATGLINQQRRLDTIADNVANVNTAGFKASRLEFKDALYTPGIVPAYPRTAEENQQKGHGVMVSQIVKNFSTGSMLATGNDMDFVIEGEGFFAVEDQFGETLYTRAGDFYVSNSAEGAYLVNSSGYYVLDENDARISVPQGTTDVSMSQDGVITFSGGAVDASVKLGIYTFRNLAGLSAAGRGNYAETVASGERLAAEDMKVVQGYLEGSNVDLGVEMTRLIRAQRAFSLASRAVTTADDMEGIANNMRK